MNKTDQDFGKQLRNAFEPAPAPYKESMRQTLSNLEEENNMKKRYLSPVFAIALVVLLCASALAASSLGLLDRLLTKEQITPEIEGALQSDFVQVGGDMGPVKATVREAISDGMAVHILVAFEVTDPSDAILIEYTTDCNEDGTHRDEYPHVGSFDDVVRKWVVWYMNALVDDNWVLSGVEYDYENAQTLLVQYVIDLTALDTVPGEIVVHLVPQVYEYGKDSTGDKPYYIDVTVKSLPLSQTVRRSTQAIAFDTMKTTSLEVVLTPLATYITLDYERKSFEDGYKNVWFNLLDASGEHMRHMTGGRKYGGDGDDPIMETCKMIYSAMPQDTVEFTFEPYLSDTGKTLEQFTMQTDK